MIFFNIHKSQGTIWECFTKSDTNLVVYSHLQSTTKKTSKWLIIFVMFALINMLESHGTQEETID